VLGSATQSLPEVGGKVLDVQPAVHRFILVGDAVCFFVQGQKGDPPGGDEGRDLELGRVQTLDDAVETSLRGLSDRGLAAGDAGAVACGT
jgi:hypothetical protein